MPGIPELLVILLIVLLIFGAGKLPAIGDALGRSIKNFKRSASGSDEIEVSKKSELAAKKKANELREADDDIEEAEVVKSSTSDDD
jgi:sec-independent protein translocase protein TatA